MLAGAVALAARMAARPTAPPPKTAMEEPTGGRATFQMAPAPVWMPHYLGMMLVTRLEAWVAGTYA